MSTQDKHSVALHDRVEPDVSARTSIKIWIYLFLFAMLVFLFMGALTIYFRYELERERYAKVDSVDLPDKINLRKFESDMLDGKLQVIGGKRHIPIDAAIDKFVKLSSSNH